MASDKYRLRTAEENYNDLLKRKQDVVITPSEAVEIYKLFRGRDIGELQVTSIESRAFLQGALMSAVEGSAAMGWVEAIFRSAYTPNATVKGIVKALAKEAFLQYYRKVDITKVDVEKLKLYKSVIDVISWSHRTYFEMIDQLE